MLHPREVVVLVIDIQEKLAPHIAGIGGVIARADALIACARILQVPLLLTEQYPEGLGPTVKALAGPLNGIPAIAKRTFGSCGEPAFMKALEATGRQNVLVAGIETHVCVFQTVAGLLERGYRAQVLADAVSSRTEADKAIGLERIRAAGGAISSVESAVFELLGTSDRPEFKQILKHIK